MRVGINSKDQRVSGSNTTSCLSGLALPRSEGPALNSPARKGGVKVALQYLRSEGPALGVAPSALGINLGLDPALPCGATKCQLFERLFLTNTLAIQALHSTRNKGLLAVVGLQLVAIFPCYLKRNRSA